MRVDRDKVALDYVQNAILQPNENIVWKGRPNPLTCAAIGLFEFLFGVLFLAAAFFIMVKASESGAGAFLLFHVLPIAFGAWMVSTPARNYLRACQSYYAITNKRVLIITAGNTCKVNSIVAGEISDYERTDKSDSSGSIRLRKTMRWNKGTQSSASFADGLWGITDVKGAADAIAALSTTN